MKVGSTFTGVGGADLGFEWAGFDIAWQCELDKWKRQVLAAHWPDIPIYEDITQLHDPEPVDLLMGGFPCQDLSVAGRRKGFTGERSVLAFEFLRLAENIRPRWMLLENVPGLLSSNRGRDFARLIDEVVDCGYGIGWRVLDAQFFGTAQRRRRTYIVARRIESGLDSRDAGFAALSALLESGEGDITSCLTPEQIASLRVGGGVEGGGGARRRVVPIQNTVIGRSDKAGPNGRGHGDVDGVMFTLDRSGPHAIAAVPIQDGRAMDKKQNGLGVGAEGDPSYTLDRTGAQSVAAYRKSSRARSADGYETWVEDGVSNTLNRFDVGDVRSTQIVTEGSVVRRLTPRETERLQGWPDDFTAPEGVDAPDNKRYAACGDGIAAPVAYWIAKRIMEIDKEMNA
jgi:DNA (cytosine-5)-methyltransferase 1